MIATLHNARYAEVIGRFAMRHCSGEGTTIMVWLGVSAEILLQDSHFVIWSEEGLSV